MGEYCGEYLHNGKIWALNIFADDDQDARKRLASIRDSFVILGELESIVPFDSKQDTPTKK